MYSRINMNARMESFELSIGTALAREPSKIIELVIAIVKEKRLSTHVSIGDLVTPYRDCLETGVIPSQYKTFSEDDLKELFISCERIVNLLESECTVSPQTSLEKQASQRAKAAFESSLLNPEGMKEAAIRIAKGIVTSARTYDPSTHFCPYLCVFQSSGYGKSRLLKSLCELIQGDGISFFLKQVLYLSSGIGGNAYPSGDFRFECSGMNRDALAIAIQLNLETRINICLENTDFVDGILCVVIDEARWFVENHTVEGTSFYQSLRDAMRQTNAIFSGSTKKVSVFFVLCDTSPDLFHLSTPIAWSPSQKSLPPPRNFSPIVLYDTIGIIENYDEEESVLSLGRPLWKAFKNQGYSRNALIAFAATKLLCSTRLTSPINPEQGLALLSCRACLNLSPFASVSRNLVARHMATCLFVSNEIDFSVVTYPSEPVLALGSRFVFNNCRESRFAALKCLITHLQNGVVEKGNRREIIARLVFLFAFDFLKQRHDSAVSVKAFLAVLMGLHLQFNSVEVEAIADTEEEQKNEEVEKTVRWVSSPHLLKSLHSFPCSGTLNFSHFVCLQDTEVTHEFLLDCYRREAAVAFEPGRKGADLLIPVCLPNSKMSALLVQVENTQAGTLQGLVNSSEVIFQLKENYVMNRGEFREFNFPTILLALGSNDDDVSVSIVHSYNCCGAKKHLLQSLPVVIICGFSSFHFLNEEEKNMLKQILQFQMQLSAAIAQKIPLVYKKLEF